MNELTKCLMAIPTRPDPETGDPLVSREVVLGLVGEMEARIRTEENKWWLERMPAGLWVQDIREHVAAAERQMKRGSA